MRSVVLAMPDDPFERAGWLDRRLVGTDLPVLMGELRAVWSLDSSTADSRPDGVGGEPGRQPAATDDVRHWLSTDLAPVLADGLVALSPARLGELLRRPHLLPGLQELVLTEGGDHWETLLAQSLPLPRRRADPRPAGAAGAGAGRRIMVGLMAVAAAVLLAFAFWRLQPGPATPWGWNRPTAFAATTAPEYLDSLAAAAGEWSAEVPQTEPALARRLGELLAGCDRLIAAPHASLTASDRAWLVERCRAWREKIAGHLAALEADDDVAAVRGAADATVEKLTTALRARAEEIRGRETAA
jgi:hypothetical protein